MRFWDASALIPLCLHERQSAALQRLLKEDKFLVAWWGSPVECLSAFARLRREEVLRESEEEQARLILRALQDTWTEVEPANVVREQAGASCASIHCVPRMRCSWRAALVWSQGDPLQHGFVCLDQRLREAARREGFMVLPHKL